MNWTQVDIYTSTAGIDLLCSNLMDLGIRGFSIQDAEDFTKVYLKNLQTSKNKVTLNYKAKNVEKSITLTLKANQVIAVYYNDKTGLISRNGSAQQPHHLLHWKE